MPSLNQHEDFGPLLTAAAERVELLPHVLEKDYWVTRVLRAVATDHSLEGRIVFKGGTSLSKGWGLISRFSEDVDLLLTETEFGEFGAASARERMLREVRHRIEKHAGLCLPEELYGDRTHHIRDSQHLKVCYPFPTVLRRSPEASTSDDVLVEVNYRGGTHPTEDRWLNSLLGDFILDQGGEVARQLSEYSEDFTPFSMALLHPVRTFAEKLLALHCGFLENIERLKVRHYYDVARLFDGHPEVEAEIGTPRFRDILRRAADVSRRHWGVELDPANLKLRDSPALNPSPEAYDELKRTYERDRDLYFGEQPPFEDIMETVSRIRDRL